MQRYTEGFRTVEDIYNILQISHIRRKTNPSIPPPKAKLMATYYEKLTTLFWVSENYLFHAFAWYKYYSLCREFNRGASEDTKKMQASAVLLAALCIPQLPNQSGQNTNKQHGISSTIEDDIVKQKMSRMAELLGFHTRNPTRESLLNEIRSKNILEQVPQHLRELYYLMEESSDPLVIVSRTRPLLNKLMQDIGKATAEEKKEDDEGSEDLSLSRYVKPLSSVILLRLIVNLSMAYHTVSIEHLKKLSSDLDITFEQVEKSIVQFSQTKALSVRIDHRAGCLRFGGTEIESDAMRSHLTVLAKQLRTVSNLIKPVDENARAKARVETFGTIRASIDSEHAAILDRKDLIDRRKEEAERLAQQKVREEARAKAKEEATRKAEEEKRILREKKLRELEKHKKIQQELENEEKIKVLTAMGRKTEGMSAEEIAKIDHKALQKEHQENLAKKKEEAERKTREAAKKLDYLVRAIRIEELPLIKKQYEDKNKKDRELYEKEVEQKAKDAKLQWENDVNDQKSLESFSILSYFAEFEALVMAKRKEEHKVVCKEEDEKAVVEAEKAKIRRARKRKDDEARRKADAEAREKEEAERAKREEEERKNEALRKEREAAEASRRQKEEDQRRKEAGPAKYVPPSKRGGAGSDDRGGGGSRFGGSGYPGGGRYDNHSRDGGDRSGPRGFDDRRGGGGGAFDRRGPGGPGGDRRDYDDRDSRRGFGGADTRRDDRGPSNWRR